MRDTQTKQNEGAAADTITDTKLGAGELNSVTVEIQTGVTKSGQTLTNQDGTGQIPTQLATAMFINGMSAQTFQDGGAVNAYVITPVTGSGGLVVPTSYAQMNGAIVSFIPDNANTAACTLDFGQTGATLVGAKAILSMTGAPLASGVLDDTNYHEFAYSVSLNSWVFIGKKRASISSGLYNAYGKWSDKKIDTTDGGDCNSGSWQQRDINFEDSDTAGLGAIAGNQLTLEAGTYVCLILAPGRDVAQHKARLQDITGAATLLWGKNADATSGNTSDAVVNGQFTIGVQSVLQIQHRSTGSKGVSGFGKALSIGEDEIYTTIELWRVA
jgi:hypothetical protein